MAISSPGSGSSSLRRAAIAETQALHMTDQRHRGRAAGGATSSANQPAPGPTQSAFPTGAPMTVNRASAFALQLAPAASAVVGDDLLEHGAQVRLMVSVTSGSAAW